MSMNRTVAELRIKRELNQAECALNEALLSQSALFSTLVIARRDVGVSPLLGQDILMRLLRSQQAMLGAGNDLARVHTGLLAIDGVSGPGDVDGLDNHTSRDVTQRIEPCPEPAGVLSDQIPANVA